MVRKPSGELQTRGLQSVEELLSCHRLFLQPPEKENPSRPIRANPPSLLPSSSPLLVISFSSITLTILVTHHGAHYHHNEGKDGREDDRNGPGGEYAQLSQRRRLETRELSFLITSR